MGSNTDEELEEEYEYVRCGVDCGELIRVYKMPNGTEQQMKHDEEVDDYTEKQIKELAVDMLGATFDKVEVQYM